MLENENLDQERVDLLKKYYQIFQNGCKYKKCLSHGCKNFINKNPALESIRQNTKESFEYVINTIASNDLKINCLIDDS